MKFKIISLFISIFFILPSITVANSLDGSISNQETMIPSTLINSIDGGWLEERDGVKILHLSGSHYEMGYQHGYLLKEEIEQNFKAITTFFGEHGWPYEDMLEVWNIQVEYLPQEYINEVQGMADGSGLSFEDIAVFNTHPAVLNHLSCWGSATWGSATVDGNLIHTRSTDGFFSIMDPVTETRFHENQVLFVRDPDTAYASVYPDFAGDIFVCGGFNEMGISISELTINCDDTTFNGTNAYFRMRMVIDYASNIDEAIEIMNSNRTYGSNFIVGDANIPIGYVIEQTEKHVYVGTWDDPVEATKPFWQIEDYVRRGNMFINKTLAETERDRYDPSGLFGLILFFLGKNGHYIPWAQYNAISKYFDRKHGTFDIESSLCGLRRVYSGKTNLIFNYIMRIGGYQTWHQWSGCPATGDINVCFADRENRAYLLPVHSFNLFDLLEETPP